MNPLPSSFLGAVARAYADTGCDLSDYCFIFPNKRAGTFFLKNLSEQIGGRTVLAPEMMTVGEFVTDVAGRIPAPRIDLVFRLYSIYCGIVPDAVWDSEGHEGEGRLDFDRFAPWAEVAIADFNEVEQYGVNAGDLFINVRDYQGISANYLSDEQLEIMRRYFGYAPSARDVAKFWQTTGVGSDNLDESVIRRRFVRLWEILPELFGKLLASLESEGLCLQGSAYRLAWEAVREGGELPACRRRVVAVGFDSLSTTESLIFSELGSRMCPDGRAYMEFFWDAAGPVLADPKTGPGAEMARNRRNFPEPAWAEPYLRAAGRDTLPATIITEGSPSNVAQAKLAGARVRELLHEEGAENISDARTAIVLPDDSLLLPLLYSIPDEVAGINLTMGYSMRYTAVASFIHHLRMLHSRMRTSRGETGYYFAEFKEFLGHPLVHMLVGSRETAEINADIDRHRYYVITPGMVRNYSGRLSEILSMPRDKGASDIIGYIDSVMVTLDATLALDEEPRELKAGMERSQIYLYRTALMQLQACVEKYKVEMSFRTVFRMADHLLSGEKITFRGEPLAGLQVLGLLETRCIDFDHVILLSANDPILPAKARKRSFIPDALRVGYGLPLQSRSEDLYAYYFWRLLSRADDVTLIYDARVGEGIRSGGKSRYLLQLDMLYAGHIADGGKVEHRNYSFPLREAKPNLKPIAKDAETMRRLNAYTDPESGFSFSASSLKKYADCQVKFYYESVMGIGDDPEPSPGIDNITIGNIVHFVMQNVYLPDKREQRKYLEKPREITADYIDAWLNDRKRLDLLMTRAINREHLHLPEDKTDTPLSGSLALALPRLRRVVEAMLRYDRTIAPFAMVGCEVPVGTRWRVSDDLCVNLKGYVDRIDMRGDRLRIVDYKTGKSYVEMDNGLEDVFAGNSGCKNLMQLLIYADILSERIAPAGNASGDDGVPVQDIGLSIYEAYRFTEGKSASGDVCPTLKVDVDNKTVSKPVEGYAELGEEFRSRFRQMLTEIYDPEIPFTATEDEDHCKYCRLSSLCGRS